MCSSRAGWNVASRSTPRGRSDAVTACARPRRRVGPRIRRFRLRFPARGHRRSRALRPPRRSQAWPASLTGTLRLPTRPSLGPLVEALSSLVHRTGRAADGASPVSCTWRSTSRSRWSGATGAPCSPPPRPSRAAAGRRGRGGEGSSGGRLRARRPGRRRGERARACRHLAPPWPGRTPVVFAPGVGGVLFHELVGHALEGDCLARQLSKLAGADGPVAPAGVTVLDDPRRARLAWRFDDEGVEARPVVLLHEGTVAGRLASWGWPGPPHPSSGHGRRASFAEPVLPRMGATFLTPGPHHPDEALQGIARGIYVRRMAAAWADPAQGKASFHVTDADEVIGGRLERALAPFSCLPPWRTSRASIASRTTSPSIPASACASARVRPWPAPSARRHFG